MLKTMDLTHPLGIKCLLHKAEFLRQKSTTITEKAVLLAIADTYVTLYDRYFLSALSILINAIQ